MKTYVWLFLSREQVVLPWSLFYGPAPSPLPDPEPGRSRRTGRPWSLLQELECFAASVPRPQGPSGFMMSSPQSGTSPQVHPGPMSSSREESAGFLGNLALSDTLIDSQEILMSKCCLLP